MASEGSLRKLSLHGPIVELACTVPGLEATLDTLFDDFALPEWTKANPAASGKLTPFEQDEVLRGLSSGASNLAQTYECMEIYRDDQMFWIVDERWGLASIDLLNRSWQSWILPQPSIDPIRTAELSVLWPMAQVLRQSGVHLVPAISVVRDGFAVLMLCPFSIEPELQTLINAGYKIIGQRWTAIREEDGRMALMHLPGRVERLHAPRLRIEVSEHDSWVDLTLHNPGSLQKHAFCDAVIIVEPGRKNKAYLRQRDPGQAASLLRQQWPINELSVDGQAVSVSAALGDQCGCFDLQLSRNSKDLLALLHSIRFAEKSGRQSAAA